MEEDINNIISRILSGQGTKEDKVALELWLKDSEQHKKHYKILEDAWKSQIPYDRVINTDEVFEKLWQNAKLEEDRYVHKTVMTRLPLVFKIAATLLFVLTLGYLIERNYRPDSASMIQMVEKVNPKGQKTRISLNDGSYVWLNSDSKLTYTSRFSDKERYLQLDGEAFFEVAKDSLRPFRVKAGNLLVEARGTSFNIKVSRSDHHANVALNTGKVLVKLLGSGSDPILLEPGQEAFEDIGGDHLVIKEFSYKEKISWKDGIIYFKNARLEEVVNRLSDWYGVEFKIVGQPNAPWHYSGEFNNDILENVLNSISFAEKFNYTINGDSATIKF